jgi:hypothetical protein
MFCSKFKVIVVVIIIISIIDIIVVVVIIPSCRASAQAVSRLPVIVEARVESQARSSCILVKLFSEYFCFPLTALFYQCFMFIKVLLFFIVAVTSSSNSKFKRIIHTKLWPTVTLSDLKIFKFTQPVVLMSPFVCPFYLLINIVNIFALRIIFVLLECNGQ